jgi:hypothetical protein
MHIHQHILKRFDFWEVAPEEGKYAVAVAYHRKRILAKFWCNMILSNYELI